MTERISSALSPAQRNVLGLLLGRNTNDRDLQRALAGLWLSLGGAAGPAEAAVGSFLEWVYDALKKRWQAQTPPREPDATPSGEFWRDVELLRVLEIAGKLDDSLHQRREAGLESHVRLAGFAETAPWIARLSQVHNRICVVEQRQAQRLELGTGFLVTDDLVLTAYHVVDDVIGSAVASGSVVCVFDRTGAATETVHALAASHFYMPGPKREMEGGARLPLPHELDFALLRLARPAGKDRLGDAERGFIRVVADREDCKGGEHILILQHPGGELSKIAPGIVEATPYNSNGTRLRYLAETGGGSSGSPCFSFKLDLLAIHQARQGDTAAGQVVKQGIPISRIIAKIPRDGSVASFWEASKPAAPVSVIDPPMSALQPPAPARAIPFEARALPVWNGRTVKDDAISMFCRAVLEQYNAEMGPDAAFPDHESHAAYYPAYGRFFWMADGTHQLNQGFREDPVFYYEIWFKERGRARLNLCDVSIVWHREGERRCRGNLGIAGRMDALARTAQDELGPHLDAERLAFARVDEVDGNLMIGIRRRLWNFVDNATGRHWSLETAVDSVKKNVAFLKQHVESALVRIITELPTEHSVRGARKKMPGSGRRWPARRTGR